MTAGLITYKLCDRDFECERCPLDAGLRGDAFERFHPQSVLTPGRNSRVFPEDRLYTIGHSWLQAVGGRQEGRWRFGLDAFASACIGQCNEVRRHGADCTLEKGETLCQIDLGIGVLSIGVPMRGMIVLWNGALEAAPSRVVTAPYGDGWIAELVADDPDGMGGLAAAGVARDNARLDLQRLRRRAAMQVLTESAAAGRTMADGGELVADLRTMLGGSAYGSLLKELIH
jgi:glycine cleavage system H protein